jgi:hypothetical protein
LASLELGVNKTITDDCLSRLTRLTRLDLYNNAVITNNGLSSLVSLKTLQLAYSTGWISNDGVSGLTNLTWIELSECCNIDDEGVRHLINLTSLKYILGEKGCRLTSAGVSGLTKLSVMNISQYGRSTHFPNLVGFCNYLDNRSNVKL